MKRLLQWKTRTWLLAGLIPSLLAASGWVGWSLYSDLHRIILQGFDEELIATTTTTAAFIRAEDHLQLMERPEIDGLAYDPHQDVFYALDVAHQRLLRIRASNGALEPPPVNVERAGLHGLAFAADQRQLLTLEPPPGRLWWLDPATGKTTLFFELGRPIGSLADGATAGSVYLCADRLYRLDLATRTLTPLSAPGLGNFSGLTYDPAMKVLWGLEPEARRLVSMDPANGQIRAAFDFEQKSPVPGDLAFDTRRQALLGCKTSFLQIDRQTGKIELARFLPAFGRELSPLYLRYLGPIRSIQQQLNLTYLYTELVTERTHITYGLDGTQGEKHSPLHSADLLPEDEAEGMRNAMVFGTTYVTDIKDWPPWGLIKTAVAPIVDSTGRPIAVVGADVDISLILAKSRRALLTAFAIGGLALLVAAGLSLPLSLRLVRPLEQIKAVAIEAAAGRFDHPLEIRHPTELGDLARVFNQVRAALGQNLDAARTSTQDLLVRRHRRELIRQLDARDPLSRAAGDSSRIAVQAPAATASGAVRSGPCAWLWIADLPGEPLAALRTRSDLARALQPRIEKAGGFVGGFAEELQRWVGREVRAAVLLAETAHDLELRICGTLPALAVCGDRVAEIDLGRRHTGLFDAIVLCPDGDFLRTAVAPLLGAGATRGLPATASALLAQLQPAWAAAPAAPTLIVLTQVAYLSPA